MKDKERGFVLSIDQASNAAGASLWFDGVLQAWTVLNSKSKLDTFSARMQAIVAQLDEWLNIMLTRDQIINQILFEGVRSRLVLCTVGAFCTIPKIQAHVKVPANFIESTSWKVYARDRGATGKLAEIKGVRALREIGFPLDKYPIVSDDVADSCLIYLKWASQ